LSGLSSFGLLATVAGGEKISSGSWNSFLAFSSLEEVVPVLRDDRRIDRGWLEGVTLSVDISGVSWLGVTDEVVKVLIVWGVEEASGPSNGAEEGAGELSRWVGRSDDSREGLYGSGRVLSWLDPMSTSDRVLSWTDAISTSEGSFSQVSDGF
jgi:hypothetical protein